MSPGTIAAAPLALLAFPGATEASDAAAAAAGAAVDGDLGAAVAAHVVRARALAGRTALVGMAFLAAGGPVGLLATMLAARASSSDGSVDAATLAGTLGLPLDDDGEVRRSTVDPMVVSWLAAAVGPVALAALARSRPHLVGPVDGMPVEARYRANRLLAARAGLPDLADPARQILFLDPGRGLVAEVVGDLATAGHVTVVVPGMGNSLGRFGVVVAKAQALVSTAAALDPPEALAAVAWLGYESPTIDVVWDDTAGDGADDLVAVANALGLAAPGATRTVVGHSYGSLVAGLSLREGLDVDAVAVTGSPGMRAGNAGDLGGTPVFALRAPGDYVALTQHFGTDPTDADFGATRLDHGDVTGHVGYFDVGTEALRNLALVATGRWAEATTLGTTAFGAAVDALDDVHELVAEAPVDLAQGVVGFAAGGVSWATDELGDVLPAPAADILDSVQTSAGRLLETTDGLVDLSQRLTSPDLAGDLLGDAWALVVG